MYTLDGHGQIKNWVVSTRDTDQKVGSPRPCWAGAGSSQSEAHFMCWTNAGGGSAEGEGGQLN